MADEQQATCHISAKLFYVSSPLASNGKNNHPEEQLHEENHLNSLTEISSAQVSRFKKKKKQVDKILSF
jgi:hypothetical protein